jgi:putative tricarboxylic transport membrane protein
MEGRDSLLEEILMQEKNMPKADFLTGIGLFLFSSAILILSLQMPRYKGLGVEPYSVPGIVPGILGGILLIMSIILLIRSIVRKGYRLGLSAQVIKNYMMDESTRNFLITLILCVVYGVFVLRRIPYALATGLFIFFFVFIFEFRAKESILSQKGTILFSFIEALFVSAGVTLIFRYLFLVDLP